MKSLSVLRTYLSDWVHFKDSRLKSSRIRSASSKCAGDVENMHPQRWASSDILSDQETPRMKPRAPAGRRSTCIFTTDGKTASHMSFASAFPYGRTSRRFWSATILAAPKQQDHIDSTCVKRSHILESRDNSHAPVCDGRSSLLYDLLESFTACFCVRDSAPGKDVHPEIP